MKQVVITLLCCLVIGAGIPARAADWNKAVDLFKRGKYLEAAMEAKAVIEETNPEWAEGLVFLGLCYLKAGKYNEAVVELDKAVRINSGLAQAYLYLGQVYAAQKKYSDALQQYQKAINQADTQQEKRYLPLIYEEAGDAAYALKRFDDAAGFYQQAVNLNPKRDSLWFRLGIVYYMNKDFQNAVGPFEKAYTMNSKDKNYGIYYLRTLTYLKQWDKAIQVADALTRLYPNETDIAEAAAHAYLGAKSFNKAIQYYQIYLKANPNDGWGWYNLGQAFVGAKQYKQAEPALKKAAQILNNYRVYALLGFVYVKTKKYNDAKAQYQKAYELSKKPEYFEEIKKIEKRIEQEELKRKGLAEEVDSGDDGV